MYGVQSGHAHTHEHTDAHTHARQVLIYGVLDVISKAVFGLILMSGASTGYEAI
jgi:bacteriorhodopsin